MRVWDTPLYKVTTKFMYTCLSGSMVYILHDILVRVSATVMITVTVTEVTCCLLTKLALWASEKSGIDLICYTPNRWILTSSFRWSVEITLLSGSSSRCSVTIFRRKEKLRSSCLILAISEQVYSWPGEILLLAGQKLMPPRLVIAPDLSPRILRYARTIIITDERYPETRSIFRIKRATSLRGNFYTTLTLTRGM